MMQKRTLIFFLISITIQVSAQNRQEDSLRALMNHADDTTKVNLLNELSKATWYYQLDKAAAYNNAALHLSDSVSYKKGFAEANRCRGVILLFKNDSSGMIYLVKALDMFKQLNYKKGIAATLNNQNVFYFNKKDYARALEVLFQSLDIFNELKDKEAVGAVTNQIGNVYNQQLKYSLALEYFQRALGIRKDIGDKPGTAFTLNRIGDMYFKLAQFPEALGYYQQSLKMAQELGRYHNIIDAAISIGNVYQKQAKYEEALNYFNISLKAEERLWGKDSVAWSYVHIGKIYYAQKKYNLALDNFQKALVILEKKSVMETADVLYSIGLVYFAQGNFSRATEYCTHSLDIAKKNDTREIMKDASETLSQIYASLKDYEKAYHYHLLYTTAKDSIVNEDLNQKLAEVQQSFAVKNRQAQIDLLRSDKQLQQSELDRQKQQRYAFIAGILLFVVLAIVLIRSNRHKQTANQELANTLSELKSTQSQLIQSAKMASLGELTAGIAHEIQNPLNFVNNFSEVNTELIDELEQETEKGNLQEVKAIVRDIKDNEQKINHHGKRADAIVKGMLQHSRRGSGIKEPTNINALAEEYLRLSYQGLRAKDKSFNAKMETKFDEIIGNISIIPQDIGRVLLNLYTNAFYAVNEKIKTAGENYQPTVSIQTKKIHSNIEIKVADNGNGIPAAITSKIFQPFFTTKPTGQGTGLGLSLSYDIIKTHGGEIKVETKEGAGTTFIIQLPGV